ncbi:regulatory protein, luxR family [Sphingobium sp. YR657]|uniref:HTH luxR-type domain-containing protein n=1 Tax=Sphingobium yanoikuyae ATCC 51230 TaxID=883163 RepID=K9CLM1_SPHYA|nr:helix-turn-helix transcriptional regulator [Sphingobium yanoikuyae]EKU73164.1 hypothetical protein HMPREF9718_04527 [Sphingobium yanoikuyae ATCC 51230]WQE08804.1 helix-turn-helix transcriptional regulator [Sphingobium yanoikuyae]SHL44676.1 regulatory protein, luxR family [Sphingobium sp. YR657]
MVNQRSVKLTNRECEVARWVLRGHTAKQIARALSISPRTAETHLKALMLKTRARNRANMAALLLLKGLVEFSLEDLKGYGGEDEA